MENRVLGHLLSQQVNPFLNPSPLICPSPQTSCNLQSHNFLSHKAHKKLVSLKHDPKGHGTAKKQGGEVETIEEFSEVVGHKINFQKISFPLYKLRSFPTLFKVLR